MPIATVVDVLACPVCTQALCLTSERRSVVCPNGHAYDVARQGYLNLLGSQQPRNADGPAMVAARDAFLVAGHYAGIAEHLTAVVEQGSPLPPSGSLTVLDAGGGTGYYLAAVLGSIPCARGLCLDVSVPACRRAARVHPRAAAVVADVWKQLPVRDHAADVMLSVFAPRHAAEFARVLAPTGRLVVVHPEPDHLIQLHDALDLLSIDSDKAGRLDASLGSQFRCDQRHFVRFPASMDRLALQEVVGMGPNAFHLTAEQISEGLDRLTLPLRVTVSVSVSVWCPTGPDRPAPIPAARTPSMHRSEPAGRRAG